MKTFVFLYSVNFIDTAPDEIKTNYGLLYAMSFADAARQLEEEIYGTDIVRINSLELYDCGVANFTKETYETIKKELNEK